ncbi:hypothetical protein O7630_31695 [Micromonospora sp. WMMD718]|uniref:hypothetical protein n=1 Tax=Micromonospora sp. WMMD718 TaxID=3016098 RepID=UPI0024161CF7|nr:hypothetical protein [Micromonospora sp. WMMD718]MDG4755510.1 hypothetical protein [Micromonospora sp. WMMD718]
MAAIRRSRKADQSDAEQAERAARRSAWKSSGLPDNEPTTETRAHPTTGREQYRVNPAAMADAVAQWITDTPHEDRARWSNPMPDIAHVCTDSCAPACPDDTPTQFPF